MIQIFLIALIKFPFKFFPLINFRRITIFRQNVVFFALFYINNYSGMSLRQLAIGAGSIFAVYLASNVFLERMYTTSDIPDT